MCFFLLASLSFRLGDRCRYHAKNMRLLTLLLLLIPFAGCSKPVVQPAQSDHKEGVYSVVVSHLAGREEKIGRFIGTDVWISPDFGKGDSTFYSWGQRIHIDDDLVDSLKNANQSPSSFPAVDSFGPMGHVKKIESFHDLHYYGKNMDDVDAKCLIEFWRPGFSPDGKRCVIRFYYGPTAHGAVGTYLLRYDDGAWTIEDSTISYYA